MALVRKEYAVWLPLAKAKFGEELTGTMEHAHHFMKHLAKKDKAFRNIKFESLRTEHRGTCQIYDYVRKHLGRHDEKPASMSETPKAKRTPTKANPTKAQIEEIKDQDAVKLEAKSIPGKMEEKDVPFRQERPSSDEVRPEDNKESDDDEQANYSDASERIRDQHQEIQRNFRELMDAQAAMELREVFFSWKKPGNVTFTVEMNK